MTKLFRKLIKLILISNIIALSGCYSIELALRHNNLYNSRQRIEQVLQEETSPDWVRNRLEHVKSVLEFAEKSQLNARRSYRYYIETRSEAVSYLVQAAPRDKLEFLTWWFPFVGRVPYLGYFEKVSRDRKALELETEGFDVAKGSVGAFSGLGWFEDPIYTSMLRRHEFSLSHLLFHELTHRSVWIRGSVEFNEKLAEFVAVRLNREFLASRGDREQLKKYNAYLKDRVRFSKWLVGLRQSLTELYEKKLPFSETAPRKAEIFAYHLREENRPKFDQSDLIGKSEWNNATVLGRSLYEPDFEKFDKAYFCSRVKGVGQFFEVLQKAKSSHGPMELVDRLGRNCEDAENILKSLSL